MSATVDSARFSQYFNFCPVLEVPGRTFPVHPHFLEDVIEATGYTLEEESEYAIRFRKDIQSKWMPNSFCLQELRLACARSNIGHLLFHQARAPWM